MLFLAAVPDVSRRTRWLVYETDAVGSSFLSVLKDLALSECLRRCQFHPTGCSSVAYKKNVRGDNCYLIQHTTAFKARPGNFLLMKSYDEGKQLRAAASYRFVTTSDANQYLVKIRKIQYLVPDV